MILVQCFFQFDTFIAQKKHPVKYLQDALIWKKKMDGKDKWEKVGHGCKSQRMDARADQDGLVLHQLLSLD